MTPVPNTGFRSWPIAEGKAVLSASPQDLEPKFLYGGGNQIPDVALDFVRKTNGFVNCLGASRPGETISRLVTVEESNSPHADIVADAGELSLRIRAFRLQAYKPSRSYGTKKGRAPEEFPCNMTASWQFPNAETNK